RLVESPEGDVAAIEGCIRTGAVGDEVRVVAAVGEVSELDDAVRAVAGTEAVVELVHRKDHAHAELVIMVELGGHAFGGARLESLARREKAIEEIRDLDTEHHGELALRDRLARLLRRLDDAKPALSGATRLRVDVALE